MNIWYTAIGIKTGHRDGKFYVRIGQEEKILTKMEIYLWSSMLWFFSLEENIYDRMINLIRLTIPERLTVEKEEFRFCFRRLCTRGLIVWTEGENEEEAKDKLFRFATVELQSVTLFDRVNMFLASVTRGNGIRLSLQAFHKVSLDRTEQRLLDCLQEQGKISKYLEDIQIQGKDYDQSNIKIGDMQEEFIYNVSKLYKKKLLVIQMVQKGGAI